MSREDSAAGSSSQSRIATARNDVVVGFDDNLPAIKDQLCGESSRLEVIPIVGMGGIGKTTLARNAYNDPCIRELFHIGGWVTISQSYGFEQVISSLLNSLNLFDMKSIKEADGLNIDDSVKQAMEKVIEMMPEESSAKEVAEKVIETMLEKLGVKEATQKVIEMMGEKLSAEEAGKLFIEMLYKFSAKEAAEEVFQKGPVATPAEQLYKTLKGRMYLIVVDDIWDTQVWDDVKRYFPDDRNGSRILITTRLLEVATYTSHCNHPYEMKLMDEDQSWDLLWRKVFMDGMIHHDQHKLQDIGKEIARSCGGLPLAIVVIAGLLSTVEKTPDSWEEMRKSVKSTAKDGQLEKILSLSYTHLPLHLRQCFVHMGGFPEDSKIPVAKLISLWIAEGFIAGRTASKSLEEEAADCLQDLIKRSIVLVDQNKPNGEIKSCSLHDLMRDLCRRKANEEKFPLYCFHGFLAEEIFGSDDVGDLRVLDWNPTDKELDGSIQKQISSMSSLRYVVLPCSGKLPTLVSYLDNIQTLILNAYEGLVHLPREIWKMQELRHLVSLFDPLPCPQRTISPLANLQTLSKVSNQECSCMLVKMIPNVKKLGLVYHPAGPEFQQLYHLDNLFCRNQLQNRSDHARDHDYCLKNLKWLKRLENLKVLVYPGFHGILKPVFPQSLKKLSLNGWKLTPWSDMTILGSLPNLQVLKLRGFGEQDEKWETTEGEFPRLSYLLIDTSDLREWVTESGHFPRLKWLLLHHCHHLREIPMDIGEIPTLELIEVIQGSESLVKSARLIEKEQEDVGNDSLQVRCT